MPLHPWVRTVPAPDTHRDGDRAGELFADAITAAAADLDRHGFGLAALLLDSIMSTDGIFPVRRGCSCRRTARRTPPAVSSSRTRCSRASAGPATRCGGSNATPRPSRRVQWEPTRASRPTATSTW
ncbi:hypothetical protein P9139_11535 [Curtobacterium flaccumfaciens]|nr:hypothetical protein P9139_11535 [Curtobacterium flaccumfaciens]